MTSNEFGRLHKVLSENSDHTHKKSVGIHFPIACTSVTILFKIISRMKLLFSNYLGDYSYSFQGSSELISITVTVSLFFSCRIWSYRK